MINVSDNSVLIVIDVQKAWLDPALGRRNNPDAEKVISSLIGEFRKNGLPIIHVRHLSLNASSPFWEGKESFDFMDKARPFPNETVITKRVNSAFIGTGLESVLRNIGNPDVYYVGMVTDHCVSTTARMSGNLGFNTFVIEDGCATFDRKGTDGKIISAETVHSVNLASLNDEFANVIRSGDLVF